MLLKSGIIVAFFTLLSRFFGLARELFVAYSFGAGATADCVNVAFKFPNLFRRIFGEGALSAVFIPIFNEKLIESKKSARIFSGEIFVLLLLTLVVITGAMQLFMPYLMFIIAPGFYQSAEKFDLAVLLCRITMPYLIFVSITALFGGMLNSIRKFAAFAFVPIIMNISVIAVTMALQGNLPAELGIAWSLIIAGILQVAFMFFCLYKNGLTFPLLFKPEDKSVRKLVRNMGPATMSSGAQQLNLFISQSIASFLPGAVSVLSYADRLYQLPLALIGITFGTILLPELSRIYKKKHFEEANALQNRVTQVAMLISIPAFVGLLSLSHPIIHLIYERGEFTAGDTTKAAGALAAFSFGLPAYVLAKILIPIFYANQDTHTPFKITLYTIVINTSLNIALMIPFGHVGIAAGSSIAAWCNVYLLSRFARRYGNFTLTKDTYLFICKVGLASLVMAGFILLMDGIFSKHFYNDKLAIKGGSILGVIFCSVIAYGVVILSMKLHKGLLKNERT